jgi:hypothetical protein
VIAYNDESESQNPAIFTLAEFIATPNAWRLLVQRWRMMLGSVGPSHVEVSTLPTLTTAALLLMTGLSQTAPR